MIDKHQKRAFLIGVAFALANAKDYCPHCARSFFADACASLFMPEPRVDWMSREFSRLLNLGGFGQEHHRRDN